MKIKDILILTIAVALGVAITACNNNREFKLKGKADGFANTKLSLQKAGGAGGWIPFDSIEVNGKGEFSISVPSPAAPEIYRIGLDDKFIYFPIDSVETLNIDIRGKEIGLNFSIKGTPGAEMSARFDSLLNTLPDKVDNTTLREFKRRVYTEFIAPGQGSLVSYYILTKTRNGKAIYNIEDPNDIKYFAAVATSFEQYKPNDPRTEMLKTIATKAMGNARAAAGKQRVIEAPEIASFDIAKPGIDGKTVHLTDYTGKGRPVVLIFTLLTTENAPAYNAKINMLHESGRADIFMVGLDDDRYAWRNAASNLPWINVYDEDGAQSQALIDYNVTNIPVAFIFNSKGELVDKADNPDEIASKL